MIDAGQPVSSMNRRLDFPAKEIVGCGKSKRERRLRDA